MVALSSLVEQENASPSIVCFLDVKMSSMAGFDVLRWIRSQKSLDAVPVIMLSSSDNPADTALARELGAQGYLKKHPSVEAMQTVLEEALEFALLPSVKKTSFLQWSYRFVETGDAVPAK